MKLTLVMVTSLDGRSTRAGEDGTHNFNSEEDRNHFQNVVDSGKLLIMGSTTYEQARDMMEHKEGKLRVVLTRDPSKYDSEKIQDILEFTNENPSDLIKRLESKGYSEGYLLGGAHANTEFFKQKLINEIWQTVEPKIIGKGNGILGEEKVDVTLRLISFKQLNEKGTLLLKYRFIN